MNEDPAVKAVEAKHVQEVAEADWEKEVLAAALPVVVHFHGAESSASEALNPRFGAVAEKFSGKVRFVKVDRQANAGLAAKLGVTASPTVVFLRDGKEKGERLAGEDVKRTALKAGVEAMLGVVAAAPPK
ncbi:thioredoxin family protein [Anaeromyxobacter oryzae]|uniref:thioredoxin family protein n=1 Tax=Anaeromyxobacter oryzae TaxID=2918170 RepID=UPI0020BD737F|nr:thioredoxin family protein [Anaeromyxobacter oryzae]